MDLSKAILAKSDQLNAVDIIGIVEATVTHVASGDAEHPLHITLDEYGPERPFKPAKSVIRDLLNAWNPGESPKNIDEKAWLGRRIRLYVEPDVKWAGKPDPGIRISGLSNIPAPMKITVYLGGRATKPGRIEPLPDAAPKPRDESGRDWLAELTLAGDNLDAITTLGTAARTANAGDTIIQAILAEHGRVKAEQVQA